MPGVDEPVPEDALILLALHASLDHVQSWRCMTTMLAFKPRLRSLLTISAAPYASRRWRHRLFFESFRYPEIPTMASAFPTTSTTSSEQVSFTLFTRMAKPKFLKASGDPAATMRSYSATVL